MAAERKSQLFQKYSVEYHLLTPEHYSTDPIHTLKILYVFYKHILFKWSLNIVDSDDLALYKSTVINIHPLFTLLKSHSPPSITHLLSIATSLLSKDYNAASEVYMALAIGNKSWVIGVTGSNIHERVALDKLCNAGDGHVLNDEVSRKWVQSLKRLITVSQRIDGQ